MAPLVTVLIPAYQVADFIGEAVQSVLAQSYTDYEIIVIDQDMDEGMAKAVAPYADRIVHLQTAPISVAAARNFGARYARGRYIALLDGDDCWRPDALEKLVSIIDAENGPDVVYPNAVMFGRADVEGVLFQTSYPSTRPVDFLGILKRQSYVFGCAMLRRSSLTNVGGYNQDLPYCEDFDLWLRIADAGGKFDFTEEPLYLYRQRAGSMTKNAIGLLKALIPIYSRYLSHPDAAIRAAAAEMLRASGAELDLETARALILSGSYSSARARLQAANTHYHRTDFACAALLLRVFPFAVRWTLARNRMRQQAQYS